MTVDATSGREEAGGIAVVGMAGRFPAAVDVDEFWANLCAGRECLSRLDAEQLLASGVSRATLEDSRYVPVNGVLADADLFDADFFRMSPREAAVTDPQQRVFLELCWRAFEDAGYDPGRYAGSVGVYAGCGMSSYLLENLLPNRGELADFGELRTRMSNGQEYLATRVSYKLDLRGPSVSVNTACSTSLVAVHLACDALLNFQCDMALAGGVSIQLPQGRGYLHEDGGILSPDGHCRAFDAEARGTVSGNGGAVVLLKRLSDALADGDTVYAVVRGSAVNNDGADKAGYTAPSVAGQARVIEEAQAMAGISPDSIGYVEAHGTGTPLGDPIEFAALNRVFRGQTARAQFCALGSVKTNVGHLDEAAGVAGLIKAVLMLHHRRLVPSLHFQRPNPELDYAAGPFFVNTELRDWPAPGAPRRAAVSSFGIGGTNAHVVLEEAAPAPSAAERPGTREASLLLLSARTPAALDAAARNIARHLESHPEICLADIAFTLAAGRPAFTSRRAYVCRTHADAVAQLHAEVGGEPAPQTVGGAVFLFPGQGSQYAGMADELYRAEHVFRETMDECAEILARRCGFDLRGALAGGGIDQTAVAQPTLFATEYAVAALLGSWGVKPQAMLGHSLGEYVAATLAGVLSLEDALALVAARGRLMQATAPGAMIAVPLGEAECAPLVGRGLSLAALNAPSSCVLSGTPEAVEHAESDLAARGVTPVRLRTSHAFHSPSMEPVLAPFREQLERVALRAPAAPFISNLTGRWITPEQATNPDYWVRHLREPVRFSEGVAGLSEFRDAAWIEVGPGSALASLVGRNHGSTRPVLRTLPAGSKGEGTSAAILNTLGRLWAGGADVKWDAFFKGERRQRVPLPTYPFERKRYWIGDPARPSQSQRQPPTPPAVTATREASGGDDPHAESWFYAPRWTRVETTMDTRRDDAWVVFGGREDFAAEVGRRLEEAGARVTLVHHGGAFESPREGEFVFPLHDAGAHALLWQRLGRPGWSAANLLLSAPDPEAASHEGVLQLLALVQGLQDSSAERRLVVVTRDAQAVLGDEAVEPVGGMFVGALAAVAAEYPNLACRVVDLGARDAAKDAAAGILASMDCGAGGLSLAVREGSVWQQRVEPVVLADAAPAPVRERGTYLITGGLGSMGLAFAEHLARTARARLVLVSRTGLDADAPADGLHVPLRSDVDAGSILAQANGAGPRAARARAARESIARIEASGGEVCVVAADVSDTMGVARAVASAESRFGPVNGVIHAAGVLGQTLIRRQTPDEVLRVLGPKVAGTLQLEAALGERPLDFFIICSSMASTEPIPGQFAYSAANAFLDAFARARAAMRPGLTVSIDWGFWQELGIIESANVPESVKRAVSEEIEAKGWSRRGVEIFERVLRARPPAQLIVSPTPPRGSASRAVAERLGHPILRDCLREEEGLAVFSGSVSETDWVVGEHRVMGRAVLPATAYLDLAVTAFWQLGGRRPAELTEVFFLAPMAFAAGEKKEVRLVLEEGPGSHAFRVFSQSSPGVWQEHARGEVRPCGPDVVRQRIDLGKARQPSPAESDGDSHAPEGFWERVKAFPPHWRNVVDAAFNGREAEARFQLEPGLAGDLDRFSLHPALLDTATGFMALRAGLDAYVPFSFQRVCVFDCLPESCASASSLDPDDATFAGSVTDARGHEVVRFEGYTLRRADGEAQGSGAATPENAILEITTPGELRTLVYRPAVRTYPRPGEVEIAVRAAGLNFDESLYALGLPHDFTGGRVTLGKECAGIVTRVGEGVGVFKPGDEVIAYGPACFSIYTNIDTKAVAPKPPRYSFEEAAGLPAAFVTAWYSLVRLARLEPGERVLIHAAAGGVGLAAVRIAQHVGAEIYATAGTDAKRDFLRGLAIEHVCDSRSLAFAEEVRRATGGEGVDVVLNSLGGEFITKSLGLLRRHGRFLELGKRDIFRDAPLGMGAFSNFISFFAVDVGPDVPGFASLWRELNEHFRSRSFGHVPHTSFPAASAQEAFEYMAGARHTGNVVLSFEDAGAVLAAATAAPVGRAWEEILRRNSDGLDARADEPAEPTAGEERRQTRTGPNAPVTETEKALAALWEKMLGVSDLGVDQDFFELQGDSLLAAQIMSRLRPLFEVKLPLSLIFDFPTVRGLASQIDARLAARDPSGPPEAAHRPAPHATPADLAPPVEPVPPQAHYPLTRAQKRLWILSQNPDASVAYNMCYALRLGGALDCESLRRAFSYVVERHESLRTAFVTVGAEPRQRVTAAEPFHVPLVDLRGAADVRAAAERESSDEALTPFRLDRPPLLRARLLCLADDEHLLLVSLHHIVGDGQSLIVLMRELDTAYTAFSAGRAPDLAPLVIQYKDFAVWQQDQLGGAVMGTHRDYWLDKLDDLPALDLPLDRPRPPVRQFGGGQILLRLPAERQASLRRFCREQGATMFMLLAATTKVLLHQLTGQHDIIVGTPIAGREQPELEGQIGYYLNTVVLRHTVNRGESFATLLRSVRATFTEALAHQSYPFDGLVEELTLETDPGRSPLFDVQLNLMPSDTPPLRLGGLAVSTADAPENRTTMFDLNFMFSEGSSGLGVEIAYSTALFDRDTVARLSEKLTRLLSVVDDRPNATVRELCELLDGRAAGDKEAFLASALELTEEF